MKQKVSITIGFIIIALSFSYFVFKSDYFSFEKHEDQIKNENLSTSSILNKLYRTTFRDYQSKDFTIPNNSLNLNEATIIHVWASWCGPCISEVPELISFSKKNKKIKFIIISVDESKEDIAKFLISFPEFDSNKYIKIWDGPSKLSTFLNVDRLPMSIILKNEIAEPQFIRSVVDWKNLVL